MASGSKSEEIDLMSCKMPAWNPLVSIMLPARDAAATLKAAALSCLEQSFSDLELLVIENDSNDETREVMAHIAASDSRARIVSAPAGAGFIAALNLGWQEARGRFLARMDADDVSHPDRIAQQVAFLDYRPDIDACGSLVRILRRGPEGENLEPLQGYLDYQRWLNSVVDPGSIAAQRFVDSPIANPCAMIRREVFGRMGGYHDVSWAEDYDFWLRLLEAGGRIAKVPEFLLDWYDSESRLTRNDEHYSQERFLEAKAHFLSRLRIVNERGIAICGAGPIGKQLARLLKSEGASVRTFFEVNERLIGNRIGGIEVLGSPDLPIAGEVVMIGAVGLPGARDRIRELLQPLGYREGEDFFCVA